MKSADFLAAEKDLKSSFNELKLFCLDIFWPTSWILLKQLFLSPHGHWVNSPFGLEE